MRKFFLALSACGVVMVAFGLMVNLPFLVYMGLVFTFVPLVVVYTGGYISEWAEKSLRKDLDDLTKKRKGLIGGGK